MMIFTILAFVNGLACALNVTAKNYGTAALNGFVAVLMCAFIIVSAIRNNA